MTTKAHKKPKILPNPADERYQSLVNLTARLVSKILDSQTPQKPEN